MSCKRVLLLVLKSCRIFSILVAYYVAAEDRKGSSKLSLFLSVRFLSLFFFLLQSLRVISLISFSLMALLSLDQISGKEKKRGRGIGQRFDCEFSSVSPTRTHARTHIHFLPHLSGNEGRVDRTHAHKHFSSNVV